MMAYRRIALVAISYVLAALGAGCGQDAELAARYDLEKRLYDARQLERKAYATLPVDAFLEWRIAVEAYSHVLNSNRVRIPESVGWDSTVVRDMDRVALDAQIGILRLGYLDHRYHAAVSHRQFPVRSLASSVEALWRVETPRVEALYDSTGGKHRGGGLSRRVRDVVDDALLWIDTALLRDSLLVVPLGLASRGRVMAELADRFYSRVIATWPDSAAATSALVCRASVRGFLGDHRAALADLDAAISRRETTVWREEELRLRKAELLAFELGRREEGVQALQNLVAREPGGESAWAARLRLALLGVNGEPVASLRELHLGDRTPASVAAEAMFARALLLERADEWDKAEALFWRLTQRHPYTPQALASPLHIVSYLLDKNLSREAAHAAGRASDYYVDVIGRDSAHLEPRHLAKDLLLETYLSVGAPREVAELLLARSAAWGDDNGVVASYKSALVYRYLLREPEKAVEILQKTLVQWPGSRYARCVRRELERARGR